MHDCLIAFGSNEGDSSEIFEQAVDRLNQVEGVTVSARSQLHKTEPIGGPKGQDAYLNAAIRIDTTLSAEKLHQSLIQIESSLGRERRARWGSRKIDLDLLIFDDLQLETETLTIPHARMSFRRFVLDPACEIAGDMTHPTSGLSLNELVACMSRDDVILLVDPDRRSDFESMVREVLPSNWRLVSAVDMDSFNEPHESVKLACFVEPQSKDAKGKTAAEHQSPSQTTHDSRTKVESPPTQVRFKGPSLRLSTDREKSRIEILAAIDAMAK